MEKNKIALIQVWFGKIPDYFWYHLETTKNIQYIDFFIFTDQELKINLPNYNIISITKTDLEKKLFISLGKDIKILNNKKACDLKATYGDIFYEYIKDYDYFGCYDIDTLMGDVYDYISPYLSEFDFISIGSETHHNRLSGPFLLIKNKEELRTLYKKGNFIEIMKNENVVSYEEQTLNELSKFYNVKIIYSTNINANWGGKIVYDACWSEGKLYSNDEEIMIYHFYRKNKTKLSKINNKIYASYDKKFLSDFYWLCYFTENYSDLVPYLLDSIKKYSNRKCIIYTINFDYVLPKKFLANNQFIIKRFDISEGEKDLKGRDFNILSSKGLVCSDVISSFPKQKFAYIDTDIYFTTNSDDIGKYFSELENYPLINSHIHDVIYKSNIVPNEPWSSTLHILLREMKVDSQPIFPRKKCNIMIFDKNSLWFFEEQNNIFYEFKDSLTPGVLGLHDEDIANAILAKYNLTKSLPLVDIEETYHIDTNKIFDYSYHMTNISPNVRLPKNQNEFLFFHRFKKINDFEMIEKEYGNDVIDCEEFVINYEKNKILFEKNSFLTTKNINENVDFIVKDLNNNEIIRLNNQNIKNYWLFYISDIHLQDGMYCVEIRLTNSKFKIFNDLVEVKN